MEWQDLMIDGFERISEALEKTLNGLSPDDLNEQPHRDCNSMGWLAWHITRVQDDHVSDLMGEEPSMTENHTRFVRLWLFGTVSARPRAHRCVLTAKGPAFFPSFLSSQR